jgi:hypothetical protein
MPLFSLEPVCLGLITAHHAVISGKLGLTIFRAGEKRNNRYPVKYRETAVTLSYFSHCLLDGSMTNFSALAC